MTFSYKASQKIATSNVAAEGQQGPFIDSDKHFYELHANYCFLELQHLIWRFLQFLASFLFLEGFFKKKLRSWYT